MSKTPGRTSPPLNTAWSVTIFSATPDALAAEIPQFPDSSFDDFNVIHVSNQSRESFAMFFNPDFQGVHYSGRLIRNSFVRTRLILCRSKQSVEQRRNVAFVLQHASFHQTRSESEYKVKFPSTRRH